MIAFLLLFAGCGSSPDSMAQNNAWLETVTKRIAAADRAFVEDQDGFTASTIDMNVRLNAQGLGIQSVQDSLRLKTTAWGKDTLSPVKAQDFQAGDCTGDMGPNGQCIARIEAEQDGLTEWWQAVPEGFQQGWDIATDPGGDGPLTLQLAVEGATLVADQDEVLLHTPHGALLSYHDLVAWDAEGNWLPAELSTDGSSILITVNTDTAVWPVHIDPLLTTATTILTGQASGDRFGISVDGAGDVNNDGYGDVVVGAYRYGSNDNGRAYVYHGSANGVSTTATTTLTGANSNDYFGYSVAGAGDINHDGYDDIIVGAYRYSSYTGRAYVYYGSSAGTSSSGATTLTGTASNSTFGFALDGAGDVNNDGYDDVIVSAYYYNNTFGRVYIYHGSSSGLSTSPALTLSNSNYDEFGWAVAGAGDVNNDGYDDVIIGADTYGTYDNGRAYVYHGSSTGIASTPTTTLSGAGSYDYFAWAVDGAGDVNGDGYDDVIVGAPYYGSNNNGRAYVYLGSSTGISTTASSTYTGSGGDDFFGLSVAGAGDVDGDAYDDVIVGAPYYGNNNGQATLYRGSSSGLSSSASTTLTGVSSDDTFAIWVSSAGDVNGDTISDVIIGASGYSGGNNQGAAYIYHGSAVDADGDGYTVLTDCNDSNAAIHPNATETCNGIDDDCDGLIDEGVSGSTWYQDTDGDGYGNLSVTTSSCTQPTGYVADSTDCNDASATVHPGATELCDGIDNDCDGTIDEGAAGITWYRDADGDGYGSFPTQVSCAQPTGYVTSGSDCNDQSALVNPGAVETCNGLDDNCNGITDDISSGGAVWYRDADSDGYGNPSNSTNACSQPTGYVADNTDCDDTTASRSPVATETCNSIDDNCNGQIDEGSIGSTWYQDADTDSYGNASVTTLACNQPSGYVANSTDCNDASSATNPAASEICDGLDNNCNGQIDENAAAITWYRDADGDGFGSFPTTQSCTPPNGYVTVAGDCNDSSAATNPAAAEICDGIDNNCDGTIDQNVANAPIWYIDADGDTYGSNSTTTQSCTQPSGYVSNSNDCDDSTASRNPVASEVCNSVDDNCNGQIDENAIDASVWYQDSDADGYGGSNTITTCNQPGGYLATGGDCNDGNNAVNPGATESCNSIDDDCDGSIDEAGAVGSSTWYADADSDGYGGSTSIAACSAPAGYIANNSDCNDSNSAINPRAIESVGDRLDSNCDGIEFCYVDTDRDGYAETTRATVNTTNIACNGPGEADNRVPATDCNDAVSSINPGAAESCNAIDDNCNGQIDENLPNTITYYQDADGDGYGGVLDITTCTQPSGYVTNSSDCDDANNAIYPGASEVCDGQDNDCNGQIDEGGIGILWYADADSDGYGDAATSTQSCAAPNGYVADNTDCNDSRAGTNPGASEVCNGIDDDCDGSVDNNAIDTSTWYIDNDGDGYGDANNFVDSCTQPTGYVSSPYDCDDTDAAFHPGATEVCTDTVDYNCDGSIGYTDADGDGFAACQECDDTNNAIYPGATEICDNQDNDCDGSVDINAIDGSTFYADSDLDGYGDVNNNIVSCTLLSGYVADGSDCVDTDSAIYPGAAESCNGLDDDCNGIIDDNVSSGTTWYADNDGDGYGNPNTGTISCNQPNGYVADGTDCEDLFANVNPGATELCDGLDNDCNGIVDDSSTAATWYTDVDGDGYGDSSLSTVSCTQPVGSVAFGGDCNDADAAFHPYATESCTDLSDYNCDGSVGSADLDGDGVVACLDCNDQEAASYPGNIETCDNIDNDCNSVIDDNATNAGTWYADNDGDNYGDIGSAFVSCIQPIGFVTDGTDCNDADAAYYPGAAELCTDTVDYNCDGSVGYVDGDGDGYASCEECNDASSAIHPGADEICDGLDNNCDGSVDLDAIDATLWYQDADADTFGNPSSSSLACSEPTGYVDNSADCLDADGSVYPGAEEVCDTIDNNCDGTIDEGCDSSPIVDSDTSAPIDSKESQDIPPDDTALNVDTGKVTDPGTCGCDTGTSALWLGLLSLGALTRRRKASSPQ